MRSAHADQVLAHACIRDGPKCCHVERICNVAHTSVLLSVVYIMQLLREQVTLFHGTAALQQ